MANEPQNPAAEAAVPDHLSDLQVMPESTWQTITRNLSSAPDESRKALGPGHQFDQGLSPAEQGEREYNEAEGSWFDRAAGTVRKTLGSAEEAVNKNVIQPFRQGLDTMSADLIKAGETGHTQAGGQLTGPTRALAGMAGAGLAAVPVGHDVRSTAAMAVMPSLPEGHLFEGLRVIPSAPMAAEEAAALRAATGKSLETEAELTAARKTQAEWESNEALKRGTVDTDPKASVPSKNRNVSEQRQTGKSASADGPQSGQSNLEVRHEENTPVDYDSGHPWGAYQTTLHDKEGKEVGQALVGLNGDGTATINDTGIDKEFRNQGHGKEMYRQTIEKAKEYGAHTIKSGSGSNAPSEEASRVWKSLSKEYPVKQNADGSFQINLKKVVEPSQPMAAAEKKELREWSGKDLSTEEDFIKARKEKAEWDSNKALATGKVDTDPKAKVPSKNKQPVYAYRTRNVGEEGVPADSRSHAHATLSPEEAHSYVPGREKVQGKPQEVIRFRLDKLDPEHYERKEGPSGHDWVKLSKDVPEDAVEKVSLQPIAYGEAKAKAAQSLGKKEPRNASKIIIEGVDDKPKNPPYYDRNKYDPFSPGYSHRPGKRESVKTA